jgi:hypothetical protein
MQVRKLFSSALVLGLVVSVSFPAHADLLKNFKTDGSIETRSFGIDNETDRDGSVDDYRSETRTRLMVGASSDLLDDVHARVLLRKNNRLHGQGGTTAGSESLSTVQNTVAVDNAYVRIDKIIGSVDLTVGRQFYGDPNDLNIYFGSNNDDVLSVQSIDLFRADADLMGWAKFEGIAGKTAETTAANTATPTPPAPSNVNSDTDLWGIKLMTDKLIPKGGAAVSYYTAKTKGAGTTQNNTLSVLDACILGDIPMVGGLGYHADYLQNFGRNNTGAGPAGNPNPSYNGSAYYLGLKYGGEAFAKPIRIQGEYGRGSDDFVAINPGKRFGIIWGEHSTVGPSSLTPNANGNSFVNGTSGPGLTNLRVADLGAGVNLTPKFGIDFNWYRFMYDANRGTNGRSAGTEYDLILSWKHSDNVALEVSAASFQVGGALQNPTPIAGNTTTGTQPITRLGADVKVKF